MKRGAIEFVGGPYDGQADEEFELEFPPITIHRATPDGPAHTYKLRLYGKRRVYEHQGERQGNVV